MYRLFDIGSGVETSIKDFVCKIKEISKSSSELKFSSLPYRDDEIMSSCLDLSAQKELLFNAEITIEEGLKRIIKAYEDTRCESV